MSWSVLITSFMMSLLYCPKWTLTVSTYWTHGLTALISRQTATRFIRLHKKAVKFCPMPYKRSTIQTNSIMVHHGARKKINRPTLVCETANEERQTGDKVRVFKNVYKWRAHAQPSDPLLATSDGCRVRFSRRLVQGPRKVSPQKH